MPLPCLCLNTGTQPYQGWSQWLIWSSNCSDYFLPALQWKMGPGVVLIEDSFDVAFTLGGLQRHGPRKRENTIFSVRNTMILKQKQKLNLKPVLYPALSALQPWGLPVVEAYRCLLSCSAGSVRRWGWIGLAGGWRRGGLWRCWWRYILLLSADRIRF